MIENVLEIKDTHVKEVMTPLIDVVAIDASAKLVDFKNLWETYQYSRYVGQLICVIINLPKSDIPFIHADARVPVFQDRIDNIVGIAYAMDMLEYVEKVNVS